MENEIGILTSITFVPNYLLIAKIKVFYTTKLIMGFNALFNSHLLYSIGSRFGIVAVVQKIFIGTKIALRIIKNVSNRDSCLPIFKELQIMTLLCSYIYCCVQITYTIL